jgi:hypothetical protein
VDVLALPVAGAASDKFGEFLSRSLLSGVSPGFGHSRQPKPTQIKLRAHPLSVPPFLRKREPHCRLEHSHLSKKNIYEVPHARQAANLKSRGISVTILCITSVVCGRGWKSKAQFHRRAQNAVPDYTKLTDARVRADTPHAAFPATQLGLAYSNSNSCLLAEGLPVRCHFHNVLKKPTGVVRMLLSTDFASESDLLDRVMDRGIVVEVWDRVGLAGIDMTGMRVTVSSFRLFADEKMPTFRSGYFSKAESF